MEIYNLLKHRILNPLKDIIKVTGAITALGLTAFTGAKASNAAIEALSVLPIADVLEAEIKSKPGSIQLVDDHSTTATPIKLDNSASTPPHAGYWAKTYDAKSALGQLLDGAANSTANGIAPREVAYWDALHTAIVDTSSVMRHMVHVLSHDPNATKIKVQVYSIDIDSSSGIPKASNQVLLVSSEAYKAGTKANYPIEVGAVAFGNALTPADTNELNNIQANLTHIIGLSMDASLRKMIQLQEANVLGKPSALHSVFMLVDENPAELTSLTKTIDQFNVTALANFNKEIINAVTSLEPLMGTATTLSVLEPKTRQEFLALSLASGSKPTGLHWHAGFLPSNSDSHIYEEPMPSVLIAGNNFYSLDLLGSEGSYNFLEQLFNDHADPSNATKPTLSMTIDYTVDRSLLQAYTGIAPRATLDGSLFDAAMDDLAKAFNNSNTNTLEFNLTASTPTTYSYFSKDAATFKTAAAAVADIETHMKDVTSIEVSGKMYEALLAAQTGTFGSKKALIAEIKNSAHMVEICQEFLGGNPFDFDDTKHPGLASLYDNWGDSKSNLQFFPFTTLSVLNALKNGGVIETSYLDHKDLTSKDWSATNYLADTTKHALDTSAGNPLPMTLVTGDEAYSPIFGACAELDDSVSGATLIGDVTTGNLYIRTDQLKNGSTGTGTTPTAPIATPAHTLDKQVYALGNALYDGKTATYDGTSILTVNGTAITLTSLTPIAIKTANISSYGCYQLNAVTGSNETYTLTSQQQTFTQDANIGYTGTITNEAQSYTIVKNFGTSGKITLKRSTTEIELNPIDLTSVNSNTAYYTFAPNTSGTGSGFKVTKNQSHPLAGKDQSVPGLFAASNGAATAAIDAAGNVTDGTGAILLTGVTPAAFTGSTSIPLDVYTFTAATGVNNYTLTLKNPTNDLAVSKGTLLDITAAGVTSTLSGDYLICGDATAGYTIVRWDGANFGAPEAVTSLTVGASASHYEVTAATTTAGGLPIFFLTATPAITHSLLGGATSIQRNIAGLLASDAYKGPATELAIDASGNITGITFNGTATTSAGSILDTFTITQGATPDKYNVKLAATAIAPTSAEYFELGSSPAGDCVILTDGTNHVAFDASTGSIDYKNPITATKVTSTYPINSFTVVQNAGAAKIDGYTVCSITPTYIDQKNTNFTYEIPGLHQQPWFENGKSFLVSVSISGNNLVIGGNTIGYKPTPDKTLPYNNYKLKADNTQPGYYTITNACTVFTPDASKYYIVTDLSGTPAAPAAPAPLSGDYIILQSSAPSAPTTQYVAAPITGGAPGAFVGPYTIVEATAKTALDYYTMTASAKVNGFDTYTTTQTVNQWPVTSDPRTKGYVNPGEVLANIPGLMESGIDFANPLAITATTVGVDTGYEIDRKLNNGKPYIFSAASISTPHFYDDFKITPATNAGEYIIEPVADSFSATGKHEITLTAGSTVTLSAGQQYAILGKERLAGTMYFYLVPYLSASNSLDYRNKLEVTLNGTILISATTFDIKGAFDLSGAPVNVKSGNLSIPIFELQTPSTLSGDWKINNLLTNTSFVNGAIYTATPNTTDATKIDIKDASGILILTSEPSGTPVGSTIDDFTLSYSGSGNDYEIKCQAQAPYPNILSPRNISGLAGTTLSGDYVVFEDGSDYYLMLQSEFEGTGGTKSLITIPKAAVNPVTGTSADNYTIVKNGHSLKGNVEIYNFSPHIYVAPITHAIARAGDYDISGLWSDTAFTPGTPYKLASPGSATLATAPNYNTFTVTPDLSASDTYTITSAAPAAPTFTGNYDITAKLSVTPGGSYAIIPNGTPNQYDVIPVNAGSVDFSAMTNSVDITTATTPGTGYTITDTGTPDSRTGFTIYTVNAVTSSGGSAPVPPAVTHTVVDGDYDIPGLWSESGFIPGVKYTLSGTSYNELAIGSGYTVPPSTTATTALNYNTFNIVKDSTTSHTYTITSAAPAAPTFTGNYGITGLTLTAGTDYAIIPNGTPNQYDVLPVDAAGNVDFSKVTNSVDINSGTSYTITAGTTDARTGFTIYTVAAVTSSGGGAPVPAIPASALAVPAPAQYLLTDGDYAITGLPAGTILGSTYYTLIQKSQGEFDVIENTSGATVGTAKIGTALAEAGNPGDADRYTIKQNKNTGRNDQYTITKKTLTTISAARFVASRTNPIPGQAVIPPTLTGIPAEEYSPNILHAIIQDGVEQNLAGESRQTIHQAWEAAVTKYNNQTGKKKPFLYKVYSVPNQKMTTNVYSGQKNINY